MKQYCQKTLNVLYNSYKKNKTHYIIENCDILATILSVNEINVSSNNSVETKKKYELFDKIFSLDKKDINARITKIKEIIINYF